jgi:hypothetical protein
MGRMTTSTDRRPQRLPSAVVRGSLRDGLTVCLGLLTRRPELFEPAAVVWHRRWCAERAGLAFAESRATLSALEGLAGPDPVAAAAALRSACGGADGIDDVLDAWLERRL